MIGLIIIGVLVVLLIAAIATNFKKDKTITKDAKNEAENSGMSTEGSEKPIKDEKSITKEEKKD
jgi:hypothetical protein